MALSKFEQEGLNEALEVYANLQDKVIKNGRLGVNQQKEFERVQKTINDLTEKQEKTLYKESQHYKDISKTLTDVGKKQRLSNISGKDTFGLQKNVHKELTAQLEDTQLLIKADKIKGSLADKLNDISGDIASGAYDLTGIKQTQLELDEKIAEAKADENDALAENLEGYKDVLNAEAKRLKVNKGIESSISTADGLMGGMGSTIKGFITNPLTLAVAALVQFGATQETITKQFGAMGATDFRNELVRSQAEFTKLGLSGEDAMKATSDLANNFGIAFDKADELSGSVARIAKTTGMSVDESGKLVGLLVKTQGLTGKQAENLLLSTRQLAKANNVAPDKVLSDVAANTELFAKFSSDGGKNILEAAVQARKLGLSLDSVAKVADGLLNFQESLNAEITASVMTGKQLNLQKARELALNNDVKGAMEEVVKQVGSEAEFNKLNALERKALADAVGLEASELQKVVSASREQKSLTGAIQDATGKIEIPEETMTAIASLVANFKTVGILLAETVGPLLNGILSPVAQFASYLQSIGALGPTLIAIFTGMKVQTMLAAKAAAAEAAGKAAGAFVSNPIKASIGVALAAGGIAKLAAMVRNVGDLSISKGRTMVSTAEGGLFRLSPNDDFAAGPGIAGAVAGGGAPGFSAALESSIEGLRQDMQSMRKDNQSYFGFGGSVSADIGTKVESKIVSNLK